MVSKTKNKKIRVAKLISNSGFTSRRSAERLILDKKVTLNGKIIDTPAINVDKNSVIAINGKKIETIIKTQAWIFYKPKGCLVTKEDPNKRQTIYDFLPENLQNTICVGRLDYNSEGLLILTNNGDLSRHLELPQNNYKRVYKVRVFGKIDEKRILQLSSGINIDNERFKPLEVTIQKKQKSNYWLKFVLYEGKNREIRKICKHMNLEVNRLIRYSYGPFSLHDLNKSGVKKISYSFLKKKFPKFFD